MSGCSSTNTEPYALRVVTIPYMNVWARHLKHVNTPTDCYLKLMLMKVSFNTFVRQHNPVCRQAMSVSENRLRPH